VQLVALHHVEGTPAHVQPAEQHLLLDRDGGALEGAHGEGERSVEAVVSDVFGNQAEVDRHRVGVGQGGSERGHQEQEQAYQEPP
jgi:hypothetical protein